MKKYNPIIEKSKQFAVRCIKLNQYLQAEKHEYVLSKQLLRSGTSIGANAREAIRAESKPDFYHKLNLALKEAGETSYWFELLLEGNYISKQQFESIFNDCNELIKILTSITKTQKH